MFSLDGRTAAMVLWLAERAEKLNGQQRTQIVFDCAGRTVRPKCAVFEDTEPIVIE